VDADRGLVDEAAAGSREAFDELVLRYQTPILNLARALTAGSADAEDLAQDVFVRAWRSLSGFRGDSTFSTWLYRVAINVIHSHRSRTSRLRRLFRSPPAGETADDPIEAAPAPVDLERDVLLRDVIDKALATLPQDLRLAVTLRDIQGLDYRAIAEVTGTPIGTVESRIFRARQRLKKELGERG
jgi:RNA polymerase sigma-70 factor (ECF subfamily)